MISYIKEFSGRILINCSNKKTTKYNGLNDTEMGKYRKVKHTRAVSAALTFLPFSESDVLFQFLSSFYFFLSTSGQEKGLE